jgi:hypothetical protein
MYPTNFQMFLNRTILPPNPDESAIQVSLINAVTGIIPQDLYENMIQEEHFGMETPTKFNGYDGPGDMFPYWSSPTFTDATCMLALTKYLSILSCQ